MFRKRKISHDYETVPVAVQAFRIPEMDLMQGGPNKHLGNAPDWIMEGLTGKWIVGVSTKNNHVIDALGIIKGLVEVGSKGVALAGDWVIRHGVGDGDFSFSIMDHDRFQAAFVPKRSSTPAQRVSRIPEPEAQAPPEVPSNG